MTMTETSRLALAAALKNNTAYTELKGTLDLLPYSSSAGLKVGNATTDKIGLYGVTPIVQRASADQAAVTTTGATSTSPFGYSEAQANAIVTLVNELRAWAVAIGGIKGSA